MATPEKYLIKQSFFLCINRALLHISNANVIYFLTLYFYIANVLSGYIIRSVIAMYFYNNMCFCDKFVIYFRALIR